MKNTVATFKKMKNEGTKISMLTAYDYSTAKLVDEAGINSILIGDSLGMVMRCSPWRQECACYCRHAIHELRGID